jgi:hypothetical protein
LGLFVDVVVNAVVSEHVEAQLELLVDTFEGEVIIVLLLLPLLLLLLLGGIEGIELEVEITLFSEMADGLFFNTFFVKGLWL